MKNIFVILAALFVLFPNSAKAFSILEREVVQAFFFNDCWGSPTAVMSLSDAKKGVLNHILV